MPVTNDVVGLYVGATPLLVPSAGGWSIRPTPYHDGSFSVASQATMPYGVSLSDGGTRMFVFDYSSDAIYQYTLATAWDVTTATYDGSFSVASQETSPYGVAFSTDGTHMYATGNNSDAVHQYTLSTAWDVTGTVTYDGSFSVATETDFPVGVGFSDDGTQMYVPGFDSNIYQYTLATAWDVTTATYDAISLDVTGSGWPQSPRFLPDGTRMFHVRGRGVATAVHQYTLSTPWDVSTASFDVSFDMSDDGVVAPQGIGFSSGDVTRLYVADSDSDVIHQYEL